MEGFGGARWPAWTVHTVPKRIDEFSLIWFQECAGVAGIDEAAVKGCNSEGDTCNQICKLGGEENRDHNCSPATSFEVLHDCTTARTIMCCSREFKVGDSGTLPVVWDESCLEQTRGCSTSGLPNDRSHEPETHVYLANPSSS